MRSSIVTYRKITRIEVVHWTRMSSLSPRLAGSSSAEANPHAGARPDGQPAAVEPAGAEGDDLGRGRPEPGSGESADGVEELSADELRPLLEAERVADPARPGHFIGQQPYRRRRNGTRRNGSRGLRSRNMGNRSRLPCRNGAGDIDFGPDAADVKATDPFDEIDFGSYFDDYLDPGYKSPASEKRGEAVIRDVPSSPVTLSDHLRFAAGPGISDRSGAGRGREHYRQSERKTVYLTTHARGVARRRVTSWKMSWRL